MIECPRCGAQTPDDSRFCWKCGTRILKRDGTPIVDPGPSVSRIVRTLLRREIKDRDVVEIKTAQAAAGMLREWFKWIGSAALVVVGLLGFFGLKAQWDISAASRDIKSEATQTLNNAKADADKAVQYAQANAERVIQAAKEQVADIKEQADDARRELDRLKVISKDIDDLKVKVSRIPASLKMATYSDHVQQRSEWEVDFDFDVTLAFAIPIAGCEHLKWIHPVEIKPIPDGVGSRVTVKFDKSQPDAYVGYRLIAIGFGNEEGGGKPSPELIDQKP